MSARLLGLVLALSLASCRGRVMDEGPSRPNAALRCSPGDALPAQTPLRRLTLAEYVNSVREFFPGATLPAVNLPEATDYGSFDTEAGGQVVSPLYVERTQSNAEAIAEAAVSSRGWMRCDGMNPSACARARLPELFARAFRRPLDDEERAAITAFYDRNASDYGEAIGLRMTLEAMLMSPQFIYRPEVGDLGGAPPGFAALSDHELATRLASFLWRTGPDDALRAAADRGELRTVEQLEAHARRMLDDPRAREATRAFFDQWLQLARYERATSERYPEFTPEMRNDLRESLRRFAEHVFWEDDASALFSASYGFVNDRTAPIFGVAAPGSSEPRLVQLDPAQRRGVLTQPGLLASTTHGATHSPILRGLYVVRSVLCGTIEPPPPDVTAVAPAQFPEGVQTTRQLIESTHGTTECSTCHARIDGAGFAFERYDAIGRFRLEENGVAVNPATEILGAGDANGRFADALAMSDRFAESNEVRECVVRQWYRFAMGRHDERRDGCQIEELRRHLEQTNDFRELVVGIATSPSFRLRRVADEGTEE